MIINYLLLAISITISVVAQTFLKIGVGEVGVIESLVPHTIISTLFIFATTWQIVLGLFLYMMGTFIWLVLLSRLDLSFLYPIGALQYVLVFIFSYFFLGEHITFGRIAGLIFILIGILIINKFGNSDSQYV